jgi:hypothetical protein
LDWSDSNDEKYFYWFFIFGFLFLVFLSSCQNKVSVRSPSSVTSTDQNFLKCYELYNRSLSHDESQRKCSDGVSLGHRYANNPNFEQCQELYAKSMSNASAADKCLTLENFKFVDNSEFWACQEIYRRSMSNASAADQCMVYINRGINFFQDQQFLNCQRKHNSRERMKNSEAADLCIQEMTK